MYGYDVLVEPEAQGDKSHWGGMRLGGQRDEQLLLWASGLQLQPLWLFSLEITHANAHMLCLGMCLIVSGL